MASWLFSSIQSMSSKVLELIGGTAPGPLADQNASVVADLERLSRMLRRILAVQQDAEEREIRDRSVRLWLEELRGVAYGAEDVLDEFHDEVLRAVVESGDAAIQMYHAEDRGIKGKFHEMYIGSPPSTVTKISIPDDMSQKIKSITERFEEISHDRQALHLKEEDGTRLAISPQIRPLTSSHVDERAIFGREEEKEKIISLLNTSSGPDFMVLPIVGAGGFGKTTLAQLVYNDSRVHILFDKRGWVSVSENFDLARLTKSTIESISNSPCGFSELSKLQDILKEKIRGISLFLVLDDVWNEKNNLWECFRGGFIGAKTVRILTTTRNISVAEIMWATSPFHLGVSPKKNCWLLFKHFAFVDREAREYESLLEIGRGIVEKCKGSPLAIKALGGILHYETDVEKWREVLESNISEIDETGVIMPVLWISYRNLQVHLRSCFLYLSMFPKGTPFKRDIVVRLWMAQGYIVGNTRNSKTLEEIGSEYFDELQGRSLIDRANWFGSGYFLLHDLIHDLASSISRGAYQPGLENGQLWNSSCKMQHVCLTRQYELSNFLKPCNHRAVRTFVNTWVTSPLFKDEIFSKIACVRALRSWYPVPLDALGTIKREILSKIACVRALHSQYHMPLDNLGTLKHLRYIHVNDPEISRLPESFCLLYNLQTLYLSCYKLQGLPETIKNLINLRFLYLNSREIKQLPESFFNLQKLRTLELPGSPINMPYGIGKLTSLETLIGHFSVMDHDMMRGLGEFKDMNKLNGLLCISGLKKLVMWITP